jgi:type I restriction enzyme S subunit
MSPMRSARMEEICLLVTDGTHDSPKLQKEGVPFIKGKNISSGIVDFTSCDYITAEDHAEASRRVRPQKGDVLFSNIGSVGDTAVVKDNREFSIKNVALFRPDPRKVDPGYFYYLVLSPEFRAKVMNVRSGSAQPFITLGNLRSFAVSYVEEVGVQQRIAAILSAYDELIENCQRRIKLLEAMARGLYREWFVHFRFPGHENHPRVASALGEIPQGWEVKKLATVAEVNRAQINARSAPDELHYIDISSVSPGQIDSTTTFTFADAPGRARRIIRHGDVLWSCVRPNRRSHAQVMHPEPDTIASTGFAVLTATKVPFTFLYFATTTDDFVAFLANNATGAAYPAVSGSTFEKADLLIPTASLLKKFGATTIPMAEQIHTLQLQIQNLRRTRDLLLPRLLSCQINVSNLESIS